MGAKGYLPSVLIGYRSPFPPNSANIEDLILDSYDSSQKMGCVPVLSYAAFQYPVKVASHIGANFFLRKTNLLHGCFKLH
jgi:hypothetical protein